ncbi:MAG TPA: shikimate dehydrogenase [Roseiarcus sp.]|nr:shikimate dehydrogenase [Roseiarcus sp.]
MITGTTELIAHLGYPTESFKAPMIYNPWFEAMGVDAVVVPFGVRAEEYPSVLRSLFQVVNLRGALVTMPHKVTTAGLVDELTVAAKIAGAVNAVRRGDDGLLIGDMFDGVGFVRGVERKGRAVEGANALVVGSGGVGSAIAASLAQAKVASLRLYDASAAAARSLADRLNTHYPDLSVETGSRDPRGCDIVVNATPLGARADDPLPLDVDRLAASTFVGEVVMKEEYTPLLRAARAKGCEIQIGADMLYEMIPAYLEFFGYGGSTPEELRAFSKVKY